MSVPTGVDAIFEAVDAAAVKLLDRIDAADIDKDGEVCDISAADAVKVFEAVVAYAALRAKVEPPKKLKESAFERIQQRYIGTDTDGDAPRSRARRKPASDAAAAFNGGSAGSA